MLVGALAGAVLAGRAQTTIGPFDAGVALRPSLYGDTVVRIGPIGSLTLDTHDGPIGLVIDAREIDLAAAQSFIEDPTPEAIGAVGDDAARDARRAVVRVGVQALVGALVGGLVVALARRWSWRRLVTGATVATVAVAVPGVVATLTWDRDAIAEPRFSGLLAVAPRAIGSLEDVQARFEEYSSQVGRLVGNLSTIYNTVSDLPVVADDDEVVRFLTVSDIHLNPAAFTVVDELVDQFDVDAVLDLGDINDWGTTLEGRFVEPIADLGVPYVFVRGNHDSGTTATAVAAQPNAIVLDDAVTEIEGIRIWGIGDPRFTPDKSNAVSIEEERQQARDYAPELARRVDRVAPVDIVMVHDPRTTGRLGGLAPLVLAGHLHRQSSDDLSRDSLLLVEGSTGGAGLRGLEKDQPVPLSATVLHLSRADGRLVAFDRITVGGLGRAGARIQRYLRPVDDTDAADRTDDDDSDAGDSDAADGGRSAG